METTQHVHLSVQHAPEQVKHPDKQGWAVSKFTVMTETDITDFGYIRQFIMPETRFHWDIVILSDFKYIGRKFRFSVRDPPYMRRLLYCMWKNIFILAFQTFCLPRSVTEADDVIRPVDQPQLREQYKPQRLADNIRYQYFTTKYMYDTSDQGLPKYSLRGFEKAEIRDVVSQAVRPGFSNVGTRPHMWSLGIF